MSASGTATRASGDLARVARDAVQQLNDERDPGPLPESTADWNTTFITAIRSFKEQFRGSKDLERSLRILSELLYGRDVHWALELLQNAEDAEASRIAFVFYSDRVVVVNDGVQFSPADVWGICSAGHSGKKNKVGFFGIGFKAVYKITETPEVYSGPYAFQIEGKIYPTALPGRVRRSRGARFVLPVRPSERSRLPGMISQLAAAQFLHVLLTLRHVRQIRIVDRLGTGQSGRFVARSTAVRRGSLGEDVEITGSWPGIGRETWRRYEMKSEPLSVGIAREGRNFDQGDTTQIVVARPVAGAATTAKLHCYLPLDVRSQLRWLVQADFEPTPGRERLRDGPWNQWLLGQVGRVLAHAVVSDSRLGVQPWELIPLAAEVVDDDQRIAYDSAMDLLKGREFVRTAKGFRAPREAAWERWPELRQVIREDDLTRVGLPEYSYVSAATLGPIRADAESRAELVLLQLGGTPIGCTQVIKLLRQPDRLFYQAPRAGAWWLAMLLAMKRHATDEERADMAATRCIPVRPNRRVATPPTSGDRRYVVAYSRSDNLADLQSYFGESKIFLVESFLHPEGQSGVARAQVTELQQFLEATPFLVAGAAGPYHVITHLVLPRMAALGSGRPLSAAEQHELWRMVEYVRNKWPSYLSDYRSRRSVRATDDAILADIAPKIRVVAEVSDGKRTAIEASSAGNLYIPASLLGHRGMDSVLEGMPGLGLVSAIHGRGIASRPQRGGRRSGPIPDIVTFLRLMGASIGPRLKARSVSEYAGDFETPAQYPWVDWSELPPESRGRVNLLDDWDSTDLRWYAAHWPAWGKDRRRRRTKALLQVTQADWDRLAPTTRARPAYFYTVWRFLADRCLSSWVGNLATTEFFMATDSTWSRPGSLVLPGIVNQRALLGDPSRLLAHGQAPDAVAVGLGVLERPKADDVIDSLMALRDSVTDDEHALAQASACYQILAETLETHAEDAEDLASEWRPRFQGNSVIGLVFAPLAHDPIRTWWPVSRVVRGDESELLGPYVGFLGLRYRRAARLWDALDVANSVSASLVCDVIARDLRADPDQSRALEFYGRAVGYMEKLPPRESLMEHRRPPALTGVGWVDPTKAFWTTNPVIADALGPHVPLWTPGGRDPSTVPNAAEWLGIREVADGMGVSLVLRNKVGGRQPLEARHLAAWQLALDVWPHVLQAEGVLDVTAKNSLTDRIDSLHPQVVERLDIDVDLTVEDSPASYGVTADACLIGDELLGRSLEAVFSQRAAECIAGVVVSNRLHASNTLTALMSQALYSPADLDRRARGYALNEARFREFKYDLLDEDDDDDVDVADGIGLRGGVRVKKKQGKTTNKETGEAMVLPPASEYAIDEVWEEPGTAAEGQQALRRRKLKRPRSGGPEERDEERGPTFRLNNMQVEFRAGWFVEEYERSRGCSVTRQGSNVGADYLASDGRYIEVKSFSGPAPNAFELEAPEWQAAQQPGIGENYYVYVIEHVADGQNPRLIAIPNPMTSEAMVKTPTGKLRISGWASEKRSVIAFRRRAPEAPLEPQDVVRQ